MDDKCLIEEMKALGLTEYNAVSVLKKARIHSWSLRKSYFNDCSRLFMTDFILIIYLTGFISYLAIHETRDALLAFCIFGMILCVMEFAGRFHKGYLKKIRIIFKLSQLPMPERAE